MAKKIRQIINDPYALQNRITNVTQLTQQLIENTLANTNNRTVQSTEEMKKAFDPSKQTETDFSLGIAMVHKDMPAVLSREASVALALEELTPYQVDRKPSDFKDNVDRARVYNELSQKGLTGRSFFDEVTGPHQMRTDSLAWENMSGYKSHQTSRQAMEAVDNLKQNGYVVWDLETTAGNTVGEHNVASHVTEFSFLHVDPSGKQTWHNSIIGATAEEHAEYSKIVEKVRSGVRLTQEEGVTANRLMRAGHARTKAVRDENGVWNYASFVGDKESEILDWETMKHGADDLRRIGIDQEAYKVANNLRFTTAESELLEAVKLLHGPNAATAVGFNSRTFDMSRLNQLISSGKFSQEFTQELNKIIQGKNLEFSHHLDVLPIFRETVSSDIYSEEDFKYMSQHDLTTYQQETLVRKFTSETGQLGGKDYYEGKAAHLATTDVGALNALLEKTILNPEEQSKYLYSSTAGERILETAANQVVMSKQWFNPKQYDLMLAAQDALTGQLRFGDSMSIDEQGNVIEELFGQSGMQRGVTYKLDSVYTLDNAPWKDKLAELYPHMNVNELTVLKLQATDVEGTDPIKSVRANSPIYYIGTKRDIEHAMMDNTTYLGAYDEDGKFQLDITDQTRKDLRVFEESKTQGVAVEVTKGLDSAKDEELISYISKQSKRRAEEEAGERYTRYHDFSKDFKLIQLMEAIEKESGAEFGTQAFQDMEKEFFTNSVEISRKIINGESVNTKSQEFTRSFNAYLGYQDRETKQEGKLFSETLTAQRSRLQWANQNRNVIKYALNKADEMSGSNTQRRTFIYKSIMESLENRIRAEGRLFSAGGYVSNAMYGYEYQNKYDINLRGFKGLQNDKLLTLSTDSYAGTLVNQVIRSAQLGQPDDFNDPRKVTVLKEFQDFLRKSDQVYIDDHNKITSSDSLALASEKLQNALVENRIHDPNAGRLIDPDTGHVRSMLRISMNNVNLAEGIDNIENVIDEIAAHTAKFKTSFGTDLNKIDTKRQRLPISREVSSLADEAANMLFNAADISTLDQMNIGYTKKEIDTLTKMQEVHRRAAKDYLANLFVNIGSIGGSIFVDQENKRVLARAQGQEFELDLPTGEIRGGQYQTRVGKMFVSMPVGIYDIANHYKEGTSAQFKYTSLIEKAHENSRGLISWHQRQALLDGDIAYHIQKMAGEVAGTIRQSPVVKEFGETQRANQFLVDFQDLFYNVKDLLTQEDIEKIKERDPSHTNYRLIQGLMEDPRKQINPEHPDMAVINALEENWDIIFDRFRSKYGDVESNEMLDRVNLNIKSSSKLRGYTTSLGDFTHDFNQLKRNPAPIEDAPRINFTDLRSKIEAGEEGYEALKGVTPGAGLTQESRDRWAKFNDGLVDSQGNPLEFHNRIRLQGLRMSQKSLSDVANYGMNALLEMARDNPDELRKLILANADSSIRTEEAIASANDLIRTMFAEEGVGYMHGQALDRLFNERYTEQKISLDNMIMSDGLEISKIQEKYKTVPKVQIDADNKIHFSYDGGTFVTTDDIIGFKDSIGSPAPVKAKYQGVLNFGFFDSNGRLIKQQEVEDLLNHSIDVVEDLNDKTAAERAEFIMNFMRQRYEAAFYVQSTETNSLVKAAEFGEKGMVQGLITGTGRLDSRVRTAMEWLGFQGDLTYGEGKHLEQRSYLNIQSIDSLLQEDVEKSLFYTEARGRLEKLGRITDVNEILRRAGFDSAKEFHDAIMQERYVASNIFDAIVRHVKFNEDKTLLNKNESWQVVTNLGPQRKKHGDITSYRYLVDEWIEIGDKKHAAGEIQLSGVAWARQNVINYLLPSEATRGLNDQNIDEYIKIDQKNNSLLLTDKVDTSVLNYDKVRESYEKTGIAEIKDGEALALSRRALQTADGLNIEAEKSVTEVSQVVHYWNRDKVTNDAMRMGTRAITIAQGIAFGDQATANVKKFLEERAKASNVTDTLFSGILEGNIKNGETVLQGAVDQIRRNIWNRAGDDNPISGYVKQNAEGHFEWGIDEQRLESFIKKENIHNGNVPKGKEIMTQLLTQLKETGITTVNEEGARNLYQSFMTTAASAFSHGQISLDNMKKLGFEVKNIRELQTSGNGPDSFLNKNIIVDFSLGTGTEHDTLLYGGDSRYRYAAMPYNPVPEDSEIKSKIQAKVSKVQQGLETYLTSQQTQNWQTDQDIELEKLRENVRAIKDVTEEAFDSKKGVIAESLRAHMHDAARNTARGFDLLGTEKTKYADLNDLVEQYGSKVSKLEIAGQNLVEEAAKGKNAIQFNYTILSKDRMQDIYNAQVNDIASALGMDTESVRSNLFEHLQTKGTHGISSREPLQYFGSVQQRQIFFSDIVTGNMAIGNFTGAEMRKEDWDSDAVYNAIHKEQVEVEYNGQTIRRNLDESMISILKGKGAKVTYLDQGGEARMHSYDVSQVYIGAGEAQRYRHLLSMKDNELSKYDSVISPDAGTNLEEAEKRYKGLAIDVSSGERKLYQVTGYSMGEMNAMRKQYAQLEANEYMKDQNYMNLEGTERRARILKTIEETMPAGSEEAVSAMKALQFSLVEKTLAGDLVARTAQPFGAGIVNHYTQTYLNITNEVLQDKQAQKFLAQTNQQLYGDIGVLREDIQLITTAVQEGYLTPKNSGKTDTEPLRKAYTAAFSISDNASLEERRAVQQQLEGVLKDVILGPNRDYIDPATGEMKHDYSGGRLDKEVKKIFAPFVYGEDKIETRITDETALVKRVETGITRYADLLVNQVANRGNHYSLFGAASHGSTTFSFNNKIKYTPASSTPYNQLMGVIDRTMGMQGIESALSQVEAAGVQKPKERVQPPPTPAQKNKEALDTTIRNIQSEQQSSSMARSLSREADSLHVKGKGNLFSAGIGIAAGLLVSGFANDPSGGPRRRIPTAEGAAFGNQAIPNSAVPEPATDQAQSGMQYLSASPMPLADSNLNVLRGGPKSSYVINISGQSPQGQQQAIDAINSAISGPIPRNSSINVAVTNNYQDTLNQYQVNRMVQTAVGF